MSSDDQITEDLSVRNFMSNKDFRRFMMRHLQQLNVFENIFNVDPLLHAHSAGLRQAGLCLAADLKRCAPQDYFKMLQEAEDG